jgi:hypothetical protein
MCSTHKKAKSITKIHVENTTSDKDEHCTEMTQNVVQWWASASGYEQEIYCLREYLSAAVGR